MPTVQQVINILGEFYEYEMNNDSYTQMFEDNQLGWDIAWLTYANLVTPSPRSDMYLAAAWYAFCERIDIDPHNEFNSLTELLDFIDEVDSPSP